MGAGRTLSWLLALALLGTGCQRHEDGGGRQAAAPATVPPPSAQAPVTGGAPAAPQSLPAPAAPPGGSGAQAPALAGSQSVPKAPSAGPATSPASAASPAGEAAEAEGPATSVAGGAPSAPEAGDPEGAQLLAQRRLFVPVRGVSPADLTDTYDASRAGGEHEAIDIVAPAGTPVVAVDDGTIAKLFTSKPGGLTVYQFDVHGQLGYYYAHLDAYAPGLREGQAVKRGQVLGTVGSTGNADPRTPHLHFGVFTLGEQKRWWEGEWINPYPALRRAQPSSLWEETLAQR